MKSFFCLLLLFRFLPLGMNVLVFSELGDMSTTNVISWLKHYECVVYRINTTDNVTLVSMNLNTTGCTCVLDVNGIEVSTDDIDIVWYRRGYFRIKDFIKYPSEISQEVKSAVNMNLFAEELNTLHKSIEAILLRKAELGNRFVRNANKLDSLRIASECGMKVPTTVITSKKTVMRRFFNENNEMCISKGVQDAFSFAYQNDGFHYLTSVVESEDIEEMDDSFFPSLLQEQIEKRYELRIFYLKGLFYSMAVFSQSDEHTKVDLRNYNSERPNRTVPFLLPEEVKRKLGNFMEAMRLDSGSIDMIVTPELEYIFLEVNPSGQYGMVSIPCGYHLDQKIALELTKRL